MAEIRISPDGHDVAIRNRDDNYTPWRVTNGGYYHDQSVSGWLPLSADEESIDRMAQAIAKVSAGYTDTYEVPWTDVWDNVYTESVREQYRQAARAAEAVRQGTTARSAS